jgi:hypothetical protein
MILYFGLCGWMSYPLKTIYDAETLVLILTTITLAIDNK